MEILERYGITAEQVKRHLERLTFREKEILKLRAGIDNEGLVYTLEEVGRIFKITRERVRQIENLALSKIKLWEQIGSDPKKPEPIIKFKDGIGSILCNGCGATLKSGSLTGAEREGVTDLLFCAKCQAKPPMAP